MLIFIPLIFLFRFSFSTEIYPREIQTEHYDYEQITDDTENFKDNKYYGYKMILRRRKVFTNCVLSIESCLFSKIILSGYDYNVGIIRLIIDDSMNSEGNIEIKKCTFINNDGGDIHIECSQNSKHIEITDCDFINSKAAKGGGAIHFSANNGKVEKCHFTDVIVTQDGGDIYYNPPNNNANDVSFIVNNNLFEKRQSTYYGCVYFEKDNGVIEFTNNQIYYIKPNGKFFIFFSRSKTIDFGNWNIQNNFINPYKDDLLLNGESNPVNTFPSNAFQSGFIEQCPLDSYPDSSEFILNCFVITESKEKTIKVQEAILKIYHSFFFMFTNRDNTGGAIFINVNNKLNINVQESIQIIKCNFDSIGADKGGAIYIHSTESDRLFDVEECTFYGCINGWYTDKLLDESYGGAIYIDSKLLIVKINRCIFELNKIGNGGAIYYLYDSSSESSLVDTENDFAMIINDCFFGNNQGYNQGGAIFIDIKNGEPLKSIRINECTFLDNYVEEDEWQSSDMPEMGGVIYFSFEKSESSKLLKSTKAIENYILQVDSCCFLENFARNEGGVFYILMKNAEPTKQIEITNCYFENNFGGQINYNEGGNAADIYFIFESSSSSYKSLISDDENLCLNITNNVFLNSHSTFQGGSMLFNVASSLPSKKIEINNCSFNNCRAGNGHSIEVLSSNPSFNLRFIECKFQKQFSIFFNSVSGIIEKCQFIDIENQIPVYYDCNAVDETTEEQSFKIERCTFSQTKSMNSLVHIVPKSHSKFYFFYNNIEIFDKTNKTWVFGCSSVSKLEGSWNFVRNSIYPPEDKFINNDSAIKINFPPSCENGFLCGEEPTPSPSQTEEIPTPSPSQTEEIPTPSPSQTEEIPTPSPSQTEEIPTPSPSQTEEIPTPSPSQTEEIPTPSPSQTEEIPTPSPSESDFNCHEGHRCSLNGTDLSPMYLNISHSKFNNIYYEYDGGAIYLINYGITGFEASFYDCISYQGGGGGIYFYLYQEYPNPFTLSYINFTSCQAIYGGGMYIYASKESAKIELSHSILSNNVAKKKPSNNDHLFEGSAIYLQALNGNISNCSFHKNIGSAVKIYNNFDISKKSIKENDALVSISDCIFEIDEKSSSSFYYINGNKHETPFEIINCNFIGNLAKNAHHIDGNLLPKELKQSKLKVKLCKFLFDEEFSLNSNVNFSLSNSFDIRSNELYVKEKKETATNKDSKLIIYGPISIAIIILMMFTFFGKKSLNTNENANHINTA